MVVAKVVIAGQRRGGPPQRGAPYSASMPTERTGDVEGLWAVIPAGGAGTRLWPMSRAASPKFLHDLTGSGRSLLQGTVDRLAPLVGDRVVVVTGAAHREAVVAQLGALPADAVLAEPSPRDSMAAIGLAAAVIERADPEAVIGSFAADHVIADEAAFADAVRRAVAAARDDWLVTLGIEPTHASTAFGYIHLGEALPGHDGVHRVVEFVEKPAADVAAGYLETGRYRWNAGMFVVRPRVLLDLLEESHPGFAGALREIAADRSRLDERVGRPAADRDRPRRRRAGRRGRAGGRRTRPRSAGTTSVTTTRWPRCSPPTANRSPSSGTRRWSGSSTASGWSSRARAAWSRSWDWTTWSSWTRRTPCW